MKKVFRLILSIIFCHLAGVFGALFTDTGPGTWYELLVKPDFNPPSWVFAPVWLSLYTLMGISLFLVKEQAGDKIEARQAVYLFYFQLGLNAVWPFFFFGLRSMLSGFVILVMLWTVLLRIVVQFYRIYRAAAVLLIPYLAWTGFALALNAAFLFLNQ